MSTVTIPFWFLILLGLAACLAGYAAARMRRRGRDGSGRPGPADGAPAPSPLANPKCEIRRYLFADGHEYRGHTLCEHEPPATEDAARAAHPGVLLTEVIGGRTHEL